MAKKYDVGPDHPPMTVTEIANLTGISPSSVHKRLKHGTIGSALLAPAKINNREKVYDVGPSHSPMTITEISNYTGINRKTITSRILNHHMTGERLLEKLHTRSNAKISRNHRFDVGPDYPPMTIEEISKVTGLPFNTISTRIRKYNMTGAELLQPSLKQILHYDVGDGKLLTATQIARKANISATAVLLRIKQGITGPDLLKPAKRPRLKHNVGPNHPQMTISQIAQIANVSVNTIGYRLRQGWHGADLLKPSQRPRQNKHDDQKHD